VFSDPRFYLSYWPIPICPFLARGVFRMEEKPAPFTKTVKSAAPENATQPPSLAHPPRKLPHFGEQYSVGG
jgi:hypothetical protein